jgi:hypothetical protein
VGAGVSAELLRLAEREGANERLGLEEWTLEGAFDGLEVGLVDG